MSDLDSNPFSSSAAEGSKEALPPVADLVSKTVRHVVDDFVPFLVAGLPFVVVVIVATFAGILLVYGGMLGGMLIGMAADSEPLTGVLTLAGTLLGVAVLLFGLTVVSAPVSASLMRAVWQNLETGEKLNISSGFATIGQDAGRIILFNLMLMSAVLVGSLFCYLPGLAIAAALAFALPAIVIHRLPIGAAVGLSVSHMQRHLGWHLGFFLVSMLIGLVLGNVPFIGYALAVTVHPLFVLLAYREIFGNGDLPRGYEG